MLQQKTDHPRVMAGTARNEADDVASEEDRTHKGHDAEIQEILDAGEAGVGDLMSVYESIERQYFAAATSAGYSAPVVSYGTDTRGS